MPGMMRFLGESNLDNLASITAKAGKIFRLCPMNAVTSRLSACSIPLCKSQIVVNSYNTGYMTATEALRKQVKKRLDKADDKSLRMVQAILKIEQEQDFWDTLPEHVKADVEAAKKESERGEVYTTAEVMKKYGNAKL